MGVEDLAEEVVVDALGERPVRVYPALISTEADALAWARSGAPEGAVVTARFQASPRGRGGIPWDVRDDVDLAFSLVLRPDLENDREGWLYTVATSAIADVLESASVEWPDELYRDGRRVAAVGVNAQLGPDGVEWAVMNVLVEEAHPPRAGLLARLVHSIELRLRSPSADVLAAYLPRCRTLGDRVVVRMLPLGPGGPRVVGRAVDSLPDGALVIETDEGARVAVRPQSVGVLERED